MSMENRRKCDDCRQAPIDDEIVHDAEYVHVEFTYYPKGDAGRAPRGFDPHVSEVHVSQDLHVQCFRETHFTELKTELFARIDASKGIVPATGLYRHETVMLPLDEEEV